MTALPRKTFSWRRLVGQVHLWIGLILCAPLVVIGLTGSVLVFAGHLPAPSARPPPDIARDGGRPVAQIIAAARAAAPAGFLPIFYGAPSESGGPASVRLQAPSAVPGQPPLRVEVDSATLAVAAPAGGDILAWLHALHANLLMRGDGRRIVGWFGVAMLILGMSGLVNWWPRRNRWRAAFTVRKGARGAGFHRELHGAFGIWTVIVLMAVSAAGVALAFPQTVREAVAVVLPARDLRAIAAAVRAVPIDGAEPLAVDAAIALAEAAVPDGRVRFVGLPIRPDQPFRLGLTHRGQDRGAPMVTLFVDPWQRRVVTILDPRDFSTGESLLAWQHALHSGDGLGWVWTLLVFLSGGLPLLFAITGVALWWLRRSKRIWTS